MRIEGKLGTELLLLTVECMMLTLRFMAERDVGVYSLAEAVDCLRIDTAL